MTRSTGIVGATLVLLTLLGHAAQVSAQQYIGEAVQGQPIHAPEQSVPMQPCTPQAAPQRANATESDPGALDPRVTPAFWGIEADTLI